METQVKQYKLGGETMYTGTIQSQVSLQMLDLKWQKKKQDINSKKDTEGMTQDEILLDSLERQAQTERERSATSELYTKLKTGGTLTEEEIAYLKEHDPEALAEYEKAQTEKKAYENALKNCRTKEDVQRLKLNRMGSFAAQASCRTSAQGSAPTICWSKSPAVPAVVIAPAMSSSRPTCPRTRSFAPSLSMTVRSLPTTTWTSAATRCTRRLFAWSTSWCGR